MAADTRSIGPSDLREKAISVPPEINGRAVVAAVRERDRPGYLPLLHTVVCRDLTAGKDNATDTYVVWSVAYQGGYGWTATNGAYDLALPDALQEMTRRVTRH